MANFHQTDVAVLTTDGWSERWSLVSLNVRQKTQFLREKQYNIANGLWPAIMLKWNQTPAPVIHNFPPLLSHICLPRMLNIRLGRAMAQAVSRRPLTAEARVRSRISPCGNCGEQSGTGTGFSPRVLRFSPVNFIPPVLHYTEKRKKLTIFITGLHNKPQGCGASVASAAGLFTTHKKRSAFHTIKSHRSQNS
jgi:hypothetical protein